MTLPNILKEFNPGLLGYSTGADYSLVGKFKLVSMCFSQDGSSPDRGYNMAQPGANSSDLARQAERLVFRIKSDNRISFDTDWKVFILQ